MNPRFLLSIVSPVIALSAVAQEAPPAKAMKYHAALLKRPHNATLFDRFFGAWIDEQPVEALDAFLVAQAEKNGGQEWAVLARYQLRRGQEDNALASLTRGIEALPDDPALAMERSRILSRRMEFEEAREDLAKVAAGSDEALALEASRMIGKSWLRQGKPEEAVKVWDAVLAAHPGDEDLLEDLVESAAADGGTEQALIYMDQLIKAGSDPYKKTLREMRRGDLLSQAGKSDEAAEAYAATLAKVGEGSWLEREVLAQIEKLFRKQDRLDDLTAELKKLVEANPRRLLIHRQLANLEASQGEIDSAIGRFREVLKRSPGERELREEFVRLLADGERFEDAAAELEKLIEQAPTDAELQLQLASLRNREGKPDAVLAALKKAHELLGKDEGNAIRISSLMFQYDQAEAGEALLKEAIAMPTAGPAPSEALAAQFARSNRRPEALELLKKVGTSDEVDVVIRVAGSISALGESGEAYEILNSKAEKFDSEPRFLAAIAQAALAAEKPADAVPHAVKLVRLAKQTAEIADAIGLANRVLVAADKVLEWRKTLEDQASRSPAETCLLAQLTEGQGDFDAVTTLLDGATDPLVIHFHAAILDRRGQFDLAIATLSRLADTDEGRKAAFFKDMAELQQRAGKIADALATVERWKQSAPGDKTAWITGSRLLRESGKPEEAVKMTRQAVARFEGDQDLAASLATLHIEASQWPDAEAIYWRLYDESEAPAEQARWAAQLAQLAMRTGRTDELDEKLQERARGNRRSIGPLLAQAELARVMENEDKRRDLLLDAVRLQPKDVDLRLQIATLEEQSGNPDRVVAVLEEALDYDSSNRIRSALAQAYLRQGQTMKGLRELQALSGDKADDPRSIESNVATLASSGMYEEAIRYLRESLPDGGDWRSRYLLAVLLEQDGRESEALPLFLNLQQAEGEIEGIKEAPDNHRRNYYEQFSEDVQTLMSLTASARLAYSHQNQQGGYYYGGSTGTSKLGSFTMPDNAKMVQTLALVHLCKLAQKGGDDKARILSQIEAAGVANPALMMALLESGGNGQPDFPALLKSFPDVPGLLEVVMMYSSYNRSGENGPDPEIVKKALENSERLSPFARFQASLYLTKDAEPDDPAWAQFVEAAEACMDGNDSDIVNQIAYRVVSLLADGDSKLPEPQREVLEKLVLDRIDKITDEVERAGFRLFAMNGMGTREEWIAALNQLVTVTRKKPGEGGALPQQVRNRIANRTHNPGYNPWRSGGNVFSLPDFNNLYLSSLPEAIPYQILEKVPSQENHNGNPIVAKELLKDLDQIESPLLRAWIALRSGDEAAITQALAVTPPDDEMSDFNQLKVVQAVEEKKWADAYRLMEKARGGHAAEPEFPFWLNTVLLAIASEMTAEERESVSDSIRSALAQCRQSMGTQGAPLVAQMATQLGHEDLAKRFVPPTITHRRGGSPLGPASFGSSGSSSSRGSVTSADTVLKFAAAKKYEAAARAAMVIFRKEFANPQNSYEIRQLLPKLDDEVRAELIKIADPGESKSLTKRMEYADVCILLGKNDLALVMLEKLAAERPEDATVAGKLAFLLPASERARATALITRAALSEDFVMQAFTNGRKLTENEDNKATLEFFETVATWLESTSPAELEKANLTWISYIALQFFGTSNTENLPSLLSPPPEKVNDKATADRRQAIARRLASSMLRHSGISEEGFRLIAATKAWTIPPEELDRMAREALAIPQVDSEMRNSDSEFFTFRSSNGGWGGGSIDDQYSSVNWLTGRLATAKSPDEILPPGYLENLRESNPPLGRLMTALVGITDVEGLAKLWESKDLTGSNDRVTNMIRQGVLSRAGKVEGALEFFLSRIREIEQDEFQRNMDVQQSLFSAAITAAVAGSQEELDEMCAEISKSIFGEKFDPEAPDDGMQNYRKLSFIESLLKQCRLEPTSAVKLYRSLFKFGVPLGRYDHSVYQVFRNESYEKPEQFVEYLESLGFLADAADWQPVVAIIVKTDHVNGRMTYLPETLMLNERILSNINMRFSRDKAVELLSKREPNFGSQITAAALSRGSKRTELADSAFAAAGPALDNLPADHIEGFTLMLPWLSDEAIAKLPESFREIAQSLQKDRREVVVKQADEFLKGVNNQNRSYGSPFDEINSFFNPLVELDFDKAVEVFLEAERRYTSGLTTGGRLSSYSSNGIQITERDEAIGRLMNDSDMPYFSKPTNALRFFGAVLNSPEGERFSLAGTSYQGDSLLQQVGHAIRAFAEKSKDPTWLTYLKKAVAMPEDVRQDAVLATVSDLFDQNSATNAKQTASFRKVARSVREDLLKNPESAALGEALDLNDMVVGIFGWKSDNAEARAATAKAFLAFAEDQSYRETSRMQVILSAFAKAPAIFSDPAIAEVITSQFEKYCAAPRSVVNPLGQAVIKALGEADITPATRPIALRLNSAFWDNANAAKAGGHSSISDNLIPQLFVTAAKVGDDALAQKLLTRARAEISGDVRTIAALISSGQFSLAKGLLPAGAKLYLATPPRIAYDRDFEEALAAFAKEDVDPLQLLRLECQFLNAKDAVEDAAPREKVGQRAARLTESYLKEVPEDILVRAEIVDRITHADILTFAKLRDELAAIAAATDLDKSLRDWVTSVGNSSDLNPRYAVGQMVAGLHRKAALAQLANGNPERLEKFVAAVAAAPVIASRYNSRQAIRVIHSDTVDSGIVCLAIAIAEGRTDGIEKLLKPFEDLALLTDSQKDFRTYHVNGAFAACQFLSMWIGQPERFDALLAKMKTRKDLAETFANPDGLEKLGEAAMHCLSWKTLALKPVRTDFLIACFSRPSLAPLFPRVGGWTNLMAKNGMDAELFAISENLPADFLPGVRAPILVHRGRQLATKKQPDQAIAAFREAVEECSAEPQWNVFRGVCKYELANALLNAKQTEEAKTVYAGITENEIVDWMKGRYEKLGKRLNPTPPKKKD